MAAGLSTDSEQVRMMPAEFFSARFVPQVLSVLINDGRHDGKPPIRSVVDLMVRSMLSGDPAALVRLKTEFRRHTLSAEVVADSYIPAAIHGIGALWHDDDIDVLTATIAFARLQTLLREISRSWRADNLQGSIGSVLMLVPGTDQHMLGALVATGQLRRRGVSVTVKLTSSPYDLEATLRTARFDAVFMSIGNHSSLESAEKLVKVARRPGNAALPVIAGGAIPSDVSKVQIATGADLVTRDVSDAVRFLGLGHVA